MIYFEKDGKTYGIQFSYTGANRTTTVAELVEVEDRGIFHTGVMGVASLHYMDRFVKRVGRKVALSYLLEFLSDEEQEVYPQLLLNKEDRTKIWNLYLNRGRG